MIFSNRVFHLLRHLLPAAILFLLLCGGVHAQPIVVDTNWDGPLQTGDTDGFCSLREAILNAQARGDSLEQFPDCADGADGESDQVEVQIASGLGTIDLFAPLYIRRSIKIVGPSPSDKATLTSTGNMRGLFYVLPGNLAPQERFEFRNLRIQGVQKTETNSAATETCTRHGAALCARLATENTQLEIIDSEFISNSSFIVSSLTTRGGAAIYVDGELFGTTARGTLRVEGSLFESNEAAPRGGAISVHEARLVVRDSVFSSNKSTDGGAIAAGSPSVSIDRSSFIGNESTDGNGAALGLSVSTALLTNNRFSLNEVFESDFSVRSNSGRGVLFIPYRGYTLNIGPGVSFPRANLLMANNEFDGNNSGAIQTFATDATITNTTFYQNRHVGRSPHSGSAIKLSDSTLNMINSSIIDNVSPSSGIDDFGVGGISAESSTLDLEHVTISGNDTLGPPAAGGLWLSDNSVATLDGTLLAGNGAIASNGNVFIVPGSTLNMHSSQFGDSSSEINGTNTANAFNDDAGLDAIQDMGCTVPAGASGDTRCVRLAPLTLGAIALDRSDPATSLTSDQRGSLFTRATGGGNLPDIGAHELQPPIISVDPDTATARNEGNSGTTLFPFTLVRNGDTRASSFANWNALGDGATPANVADFTATSGSAFFDIGETSATVNVGVVGDLDSEANEGFRLQLAALTNGVQGVSSSKGGTIINDDALLPAALVSIAPVAINGVEGDFLIGSEQRFRLTRSQVLGGICSFQIELSAIGPAGVSDDDFVNLNLGTTTVVMGSGQEVADYVVQVAGDGLYEGDEAYRVELLNPSGCFIDSTASSVDAMIVDDEALYRVDADAVAQFEGDTGTTPFTFTVSRAGYLADSGSVDWEVVGFGGLAAQPDDFAGGVFPSGTALFLPGTDEFTITVEVVADDIGEFDEQFAVVISNPFGGEISVAEAVATIVNDDASDLLFSDGFE